MRGNETVMVLLSPSTVAFSSDLNIAANARPTGAVQFRYGLVSVCLVLEMCEREASTSARACAGRDIDAQAVEAISHNVSPPLKRLHVTSDLFEKGADVRLLVLEDISTHFPNAHSRCWHWESMTNEEG